MSSMDGSAAGEGLERYASDPSDFENQLQPEDTLIEDGVDDVLDRGYSPPDSARGSMAHGVTADEARHEETIEERIRQEVPDPATAYGAPDDESGLDRERVGGDDPDAIDADDDWLGDAEVEGDLLVQPPRLQPLQNAQLRGREAGYPFGQVVVLGLGHVRRPAVAGQDGGDGLDHLRQGGGLGDEAGGAQTQGVSHHRRLLAGRDHRHGRGRMFGPQRRQARHPLAVRQFQIQQQQIALALVRAERDVALRDSGMRTLRQDGIEKALQGLTTLEEVLAVTAN